MSEPLTFRFEGRREEGKQPVVTCNGEPLENVKPDVCDWFSWGSDRSPGCIALAWSMADVMNHYIDNGNDEVRLMNEMRSALGRIKGNTWTLELEV